MRKIYYWRNIFLLNYFIFILFGIFNKVFSQSIEDWIEVVTPKEGELIIEKRPEIILRSLLPIQSDSVLLILDGTDVSQLAEISDKKIYFRPFLPLSAGDHKLSFRVCSVEGNCIEKEITFKSQHYKFVEEFLSENQITGTYEEALKKPSQPENEPDRKIEAFLNTNTSLKQAGLKTSFTAQIRYYDQNTSLSPPQQKGFELINWVFATNYNRKNFSFRSDIGDIQITQTPLTIRGLGRRGGFFHTDYKNWNFEVFSVKSEQVLGLEGGIGISPSTDRHILGFSGGFKAFQNQLEFKTVYIEGQEPGESYGVFTSPENKKGRCWGNLFRFQFSPYFSTETELVFSRYDPDTNDEFGAKSDYAFRISASGTWKNFNYQALYEYLGPNFEIISQSQLKDQKGFSFNGGVQLGVHALSLNFSRYINNVKEDPLFPILINTQMVLNYSLNKFPSLPINLSYQRNMQNSRHEPENTSPVEINTDTFTGQVSFTKGSFSFNLTGSYSYTNDKTEQDNDISNLSFSLIPSYNRERFSIGSSLAYNRSKNYVSDTVTDTYTFNLDLNFNFFQKSNFSLSGTYSITKDNQDLTNIHTLGIQFNIAYKELPSRAWFIPVLHLKGRYDHNWNRISHISDEEYGIYLVFAVNMPFTF